MRIRRTGLVPRPQFVRDARIFVIAVEGENTEAQYFGSSAHLVKRTLSCFIIAAASANEDNCLITLCLLSRRNGADSAIFTQSAAEPYFSLFKSTRVRVEVLPAGPEGLSAPRQVLERLVAFEERFDLDADDERWLVIDVDQQRGQFLDEVTQVARESGYGLAISNPCFELWLLLHFQDADPSDTDCAAVINRLRPHVGGYNKARIKLAPYTPDRTREAVARARALEGGRDMRWPNCPGTHAFKVVERLLRLLTS